MNEQVLRMALACIRWSQFGECRTDGWPGLPPTAADTVAALEASLAKPQPVGGALTDEVIDATITAHGTGGWQTPADMRKFARAIEAATLSAPVAQPGEAVPRRPSAPAAQPEQGCRWPWLHCGSTSPCDICTPPVAGVTRCQHCGGCGELFQHDGRSAGECPHCADAAQPAAALPRSYRSSVLVTGNDNSTEGAKVSFYFNEVADAYAWYEAITEAAPAQAAAVPESSSVSIDFRQATELLEMFGGEPTEITLMAGDGHSGPGLYAVYNADPEGSVHLGETDEEAVPDAPVSQAAAVPEAVEPSEYLRGYMEGKREAAPPAGISPAPLAGNSEAMHAKAFVAYRATDPSVCGFALFMAGWRAALSQGDVSGEGEGS